jgi:hypothetical protein
MKARIHLRKKAAHAKNRGFFGRLFASERAKRRSLTGELVSHFDEKVNSNREVKLEYPQISPNSPP